MSRPERRTRGLVRGLGWASLALGTPQVAAPDAVARAAGVTEWPRASDLVRLVGIRGLGLGVGLLAGPPATVWTRVAGDAMDLGLLGYALARGRQGRARTAAAAGVVLAITAVDVVTAVRSLRTQHGADRPGPLQLEAVTTVRRSPQQVYAYWRDLERLPSFMHHLESVTETAGGLSRWVAKAPVRGSVTWEAELTGDEPGRRLAWRSLPGGDVDDSGTVHFAETPDGGTEVKVVLHYDVPGGAVGRAVAWLLGEEPEQQVRDDLHRFKLAVEGTPAPGAPEPPLQPAAER